MSLLILHFYYCDESGTERKTEREREKERERKRENQSFAYASRKKT